MNLKKKQIKVFVAATSFVLAALGSKVSLAYWASAVTGNNNNANGDLNTGTWDRYTTGTAIGTCAALRTMLNTASSSTYHLTANLNCSTTASPTGTPTFSGILYGNGFTISNFAISSARKGLFYNLSNAKIQNLILDNVDVGTSTDRSNNFTGILASEATGATTTINKVRIYNSSAYCSSSLGVGGVIGYVTKTTNITDVMMQNVILNNSNSNAGGIVGRLSGAPLTISDVYVEGTVQATSNAGPIVGQIDNAASTVLTLSRAVAYGNTTVTVTNSYAGGAVGNNARSASHSLTDVFYTGALNASNNRAGTIYNGTSMTYTNAWAAQWSSSTIASYTNMTGTSANYTTNYVAARTSLSSSWWTTNMPNIATNGRWTYDASTYLYELKPRV